MRTRSLSMALLAGVVIAVASPISAQEYRRDGFWLTAGVSAGWFQIDVDGETDAEWSYSGALAMGGTVGNNLQIGGGLQGWTWSESDVEAAAVAILGIVNWYVNPDKGFYVRAGAGFQGYAEDFLGEELTSGGVASLLGAGYDFAVSESVGLGLYATVLYTPFRSRIDLGGSDTGFEMKSTWVQFGAQLAVF